MYVLVLDRALRVKEKEDPFTKFYWGSNETHIWSAVVREIGKILYALKKVETAEAVSLPNLGNGRLASVALPVEKVILADTVYVALLEPTPRPEPIAVLPLDGGMCNLL